MKRTTKGQFVKGVRSNPSTEFKKGQHWRKPKPWWKREWLFNQYVTLKKSTGDIAREQAITDSAVIHWLDKHGIPKRTQSQARGVKHWGQSGKDNPMYGKRGVLNPNWKGGLTPLRQRIYSRSEWKQFMRDVWARDRCCRLCGEKEKCEIHHIDPFSQAPLLVMDIGNVILLCYRCHLKLRGQEKRWKRRLFAIIQKAAH